ncbi:DUF2933 domain-containing protein [Ideonella alba]|jgi:hypothetical protein|uniref:DUF2933 domain-containing protein n=1 Tax=Ideonella alba TaxID=2824118 RepID=A0A940YBJ3_9BURK|nr:DUF2933 domain-containing protein [Ideonella alba]MBI5271403.1 DUF2933 domain-containing protein [Burkholderiales bacterium]MBQ0932533.1 DUF2933 domain-containing protein [Ideonella alba]
MNHDHDEPIRRARGFWRSRYAIGLLVFAAIALFFLLTEHRAHTLGALPYLLLAASPFLHIFMHRGHGHGHGDAHDGKGPSNDRPAGPEASEGRSRKTHHHH